MERFGKSNQSDTNTDNILVIIPVRNEAATIAAVVRDLQSYGLTRIRAVDNGSMDDSVAEAKQAGAEVLFEPIAGYGCACWRGLQDLPLNVEWILFVDGDGSDDLSCLVEFFQKGDRYDLILGDRTATAVGKSVMTPVQKFGNALATQLIHWGWQHRYHDLGPLRMIRRTALNKFAMQDRGMGWTVEMQVRAIEENLRICELPVGYRPRQGGKSKISGTIVGSIKAGTVILTTLGKLAWRRFVSERLLLWLSAIFLLSGAMAIAPYGDFRDPQAVVRFGWGIAIMSLGFICSWCLTSVSVWWYGAIAILTRLILLPMYPGDDVWRYVWEGYIQTQGFSPYELAPNAVELIPYRPEWWTQINHQNVSAIYPPLAQLGFRSLAAIAPNFLLFKAAFVVADLFICFLLSRQFSYLQTTLYAWNPLVIYCFAGGGHYDSWFILPLVAAGLFFARQSKATASNLSKSRWQWYLSAILVGISVAVKWISLPILGFVAWQAWRKLNFLTATILFICGLVPFLLAAAAFCNGDCSLIPTGSDFVRNGRSAEFIPYFIGKAWQASRSTNSIWAIPLGLGVIVLIFTVNNFYRFGRDFFFWLLIISPIVHGWYFTWIVPFAVKSQNWGVRLVSVSAFIYFVLPYRQALGNYSWHLHEVETWCLWLPFVVGYICSTIYNE